MRSNNTFGVHFIIRQNQNGNYTIFARIVVNKSRCELGLKQTIEKDDCNQGKGAAKPKTPALKQLNSYLEEVRAKVVTHYQQLDLDDHHVTAEAVKASYLGQGSKAEEEKMTLNKLVAMHNEMMQKVLERGTMKNYYSTALYLKKYMSKKYLSGDIQLKDLNFAFITGFEFYIRNNPLKAGDPCTNNGTMKHLERLKKMVSNQEVNRSLKLIGEICEVKKRLTFHLARHTFATTVTLLYNYPSTINITSEFP